MLKLSLSTSTICKRPRSTRRELTKGAGLSKVLCDLCDLTSDHFVLHHRLRLSEVAHILMLPSKSVLLDGRNASFLETRFAIDARRSNLLKYLAADRVLNVARLV